jgi:outer membrane protein assembly factor BamB
VRRRVRVAAASAAVALVAAACAGNSVPASNPAPTSSSISPAAGHAAFGSNWTVYHGDPAGGGLDTAGTDLSPAHALWTSAQLDGSVYGEPLVDQGRVYIATENDTVYALAANTGAVLWKTHVATPVPSSGGRNLLPCGNITPTVGMTGTPVIDAARAEIYVVADEKVGNNAQHRLVGLDIFTGAVLLNQDADPPGSHPLYQLQRTGLNLTAGQVVFGYGGNDGDCETGSNPYHGWIVGIPEGGGTMRTFEADANPGDTEGAVWMGGAAPPVDSAGNVWLATGNGNGSTTNPDHGDSVIQLSSQLKPLQTFTPKTWVNDNNSDADLGSASPALIGSGTVFQAGKSQTAYLMDQAHLGGIGGQTDFATGFCGSDVDGGTAVNGPVVYAPCLNGLVAVQVNPATHKFVGSPLWQTPTGSPGPAIVSDNQVWTIDKNNATLYALNPANGNESQSFALGSEANSFPTPSVADGLLLAPSADRIHAFDGPSGPPPAPPPAPKRPGYRTTTTTGAVADFGGAPGHGSLAGRHLNAPVVGMATDPLTGGYWLVARDGGVFSFGAPYHGSEGGHHLNAPVVGMAADPTTGGYWLVARDGGIFSFGAPYGGSEGGHHLNAPIVGMAAAATGGYRLVAADGGVFTFGGAPFHGSEGGHHLNAPMVGLASDDTTGGYWLVAADGGVFTFDAPYEGSEAGQHLNAPMVGMAANTGGGYWLAAGDGGIFAKGAPFFGASVASALAPVIGVSAFSPIA